MYNVPLDTVKLAVVIGIVISMFFYEKQNLTPGGVIVPGYVALTLNNPVMIASTIFVSLITFFLVRKASNYVILFGRRKFSVMMLTSFLIAWAVETILQTVLWSVQWQLSVNSIFQVIGFIIPGLIANAMDRQGVVHTVYPLGLISILTYLVLFVFVGLW